MTTEALALDSPPGSFLHGSGGFVDCRGVWHPWDEDE